MDKREDQTTRNAENTMEGKLSVSFKNNKALNDFCQSTFNNFDPMHYDIVALRFYHGTETILTLYALDKARHNGQGNGSLPVKKFKVVDPALATIMTLVRELNFTITNGDYPLGAIEVINK